MSTAKLNTPTGRPYMAYWEGHGWSMVTGEAPQLYKTMFKPLWYHQYSLATCSGLWCWYCTGKINLFCSTLCRFAEVIEEFFRNQHEQWVLIGSENRVFSLSQTYKSDTTNPISVINISSILLLLSIYHQSSWRKQQNKSLSIGWSPPSQHVSHG